MSYMYLLDRPLHATYRAYALSSHSATFGLDAYFYGTSGRLERVIYWRQKPEVSYDEKTLYRIYKHRR